MITEIKPKQYKVQGHLFELLPTTPRNRVLASSMLGDNFERLTKAFDEMPDNEVSIAGLLHAYDEFRVYYDLFCALTKGPHEKLDYMDFDISYGQQVCRDFFTHATVMMLTRLGFIDSSTPSNPSEEENPLLRGGLSSSGSSETPSE